MSLRQCIRLGGEGDTSSSIRCVEDSKNEGYGLVGPRSRGYLVDDCSERLRNDQSLWSLYPDRDRVIFYGRWADQEMRVRSQ